MKIDIKITPLERSEDVEDKYMFYLKISSYKEKIEGKFERSELRQLIETIDNAI